jgi:hypothetical protein
LCELGRKSGKRPFVAFSGFFLYYLDYLGTSKISENIL